MFFLLKNQLSASNSKPFYKRLAKFDAIIIELVGFLYRKRYILRILLKILISKDLICLFYKILLIKFKFNIYKIKINKFTSNGFFRRGLFKPLRVLVKIKKFVKMKIRRGYNYVLVGGYKKKKYKKRKRVCNFIEKLQNC